MSIESLTRDCDRTQRRSSMEIRAHLLQIQHAHLAADALGDIGRRLDACSEVVRIRMGVPDQRREGIDALDKGATNKRDAKEPN